MWTRRRARKKKVEKKTPVKGMEIETQPYGGVMDWRERMLVWYYGKVLGFARGQPRLLLLQLLCLFSDLAFYYFLKKEVCGEEIEKRETVLFVSGSVTPHYHG